jgi:hypothetical protein
MVKQNQNLPYLQRQRLQIKGLLYEGITATRRISFATLAIL